MQASTVPSIDQVHFSDLIWITYKCNFSRPMYSPELHFGALWPQSATLLCNHAVSDCSWEVIYVAYKRQFDGGSVEIYVESRDNEVAPSLIRWISLSETGWRKRWWSLTWCASLMRCIWGTPSRALLVYEIISWMSMAFESVASENGYLFV